MANKRMFSIGIIDSDQFLDMSMEARLLYYDLGMRADDDGFVNSPKKIMRITKATDKSLDELEDKGFIFRFVSGVLVIRHWNINNNMRKDTYHETSYTEEKAQLVLDSASIYQLRNEYVTDSSRDYNDDETECAEDVSQIRLDKNSISLDKPKISSDKNSLDSICSEQKISSELEQPTKSDDCIEFPVLGGSTYIPMSLIEEWKSVYTNVDVMQEVLKAREWCRANPKRLKVKWKRFLVNWLNESQDKRPRYDNRPRTNGPNRCMEPDKVIEAEEAGF